MKAEGDSDAKKRASDWVESLLRYRRRYRQKLIKGLTVEEIIEWKNQGRE